MANNEPSGWQAVMATRAHSEQVSRTLNALLLLARLRGKTVVVVLISLLSVDGLAFELFDFDREPIAPANDLPSWSILLDRVKAQKHIIDGCLQDEASCEGRLRSVHHLVQNGRTLSRDKQVRLVNRYVNRFSRYRDDKRRDVAVAESNVRVSQEWSTLVDFLSLGGDCEDYATAKYQLLRRLGIPAKDLRVIVVYDWKEREHHALVGVADVEDSALLLDTDNLTYRRRPPMYRFVYAVNENHVWDFGIEDTPLSWSVRRALRKKQKEEGS